MKKPLLWLVIAKLAHPEIAYVIPTIAWMARDSGALLENYLESDREGRLFAETGSTILGGHHHQQFNYLCARFEVQIVKLGSSQVFDSSIQSFKLKVLAESPHAGGLYTALARINPALQPAGIFVGPSHPLQTKAGAIRIQPYLFPEILYRKALGFSASSRFPPTAKTKTRKSKPMPVWSAFVEPKKKMFPAPVRVLDRLKSGDDWNSITTRLAQRWKHQAKGVVFGDPAAVLSQLATHCRHDRVALYAPVTYCPPAETSASYYTESISPAAGTAAALALEIGNPVLHGRQTGDGDIFEWSKQGVCIQIIDPNRPVFPVVEEAVHPWNPSLRPPAEPDDAQLISWAQAGKVLTTLVVHSGEVAHNEAMLALVEMAGWSGLKLGIGVHAQRYESCPQLWELIAAARENGGASGLVEPLLHSGGRGVMAECHCPPDLLAAHCESSLQRIRSIAGPAHVPNGYYAFMDSNLDRLDRVRGDLFSAIASQGLQYIISSARPGRNRVLWKSGRCLALNQTPRVIHGASPFVRISTADDLETTTGAAGAGWLIATLDAPVVAFAPYIWREGNKIMKIVDNLNRHGRINVLPSTIARYAKIMARMKLLPAPVCRGNSVGTIA